MTLEKHLALEAKVESLQAQVDELQEALYTKAGVEGAAPNGLQAQLENLEKAFVKVASMTGSGNIIQEFGYKMWVPEPKDMNRYVG